MLQFTVIGGPNGAGKSTFSTHMSRPGTLVFDPDFYKKTIEKQFPDISDEAIEEAVTAKYETFELNALGRQKHLTVETNLRNEFLVERAAIFKQAGYQTRLIFMLLPDVESSMDRVNLRVKQKGHFVDAESIRYNFTKSLENLIKVVTRFDQVMLVCAASEYGILSKPTLLVTIKGNTVVELGTHIPEWVMPVVQDVIELKSGHERGPGYKR